MRERHRTPTDLDRSTGSDPLDGARRILLYGVTGSGKTTAASRISAVTGIPWTSVDDLTWEPGWVMVDPDEQRRRIAEICRGETWVLDTAYGDWVDVPLARAEVVVALDYPRWFSLQRLVRRTLARVVDRREICNGNVETWRQLVSDDSIVRWHFRSFRRKRERIETWSADPAAPPVLRFRRARDLETWIGRLHPVVDEGVEGVAG